ncbi:MAG: AAA family ATPase, partial [Chitinophagales bacterium]
VCIYGCKSCKNIHQNFEKTITTNSTISKTGNSYKTTPSNKDLLSYKSAINAIDLTNKKFSFAAFGYSGYRLLETENIEITDKEKGNPLHLALEFNKRKDDRAFSISNWIASRWSKAAIEEISGNKEGANKIRFAINRLIECINNFTNNDYTIKIETNPWRIGISYCGSILEFDVLPDGLRSILSWLGDLLMRLDAIPWEENSISITEQNIILFLDEIEVHLHPTWQDKILPLLKEILPNAQIFITTHSPFILNSIDNAKIYMLNNENCETRLEKIVLSETGDSYQYVYENILYTKNIFGHETIKLIERFNEIDKEIVLSDFSNENEFI